MTCPRCHDTRQSIGAPESFGWLRVKPWTLSKLATSTRSAVAAPRWMADYEHPNGQIDTLVAMSPLPEFLAAVTKGKPPPLKSFVVALPCSLCLVKAT